MTVDEIFQSANYQYKQENFDKCIVFVKSFLD